MSSIQENGEHSHWQKKQIRNPHQQGVADTVLRAQEEPNDEEISPWAHNGFRNWTSRQTLITWSFECALVVGICKTQAHLQPIRLLRVLQRMPQITSREQRVHQLAQTPEDARQNSNPATKGWELKAQTKDSCEWA